MIELMGVSVFVVVQQGLVENVQAYIDPATGSMLIQAVIAGLVSVLVFWRQCFAFIKRLFGRKKDE